jgi:hypothetical protein
MPIDPTIAMGVRPIEQPNMLGQMAQVMAMRQAQQEYENEGGLRNALTGGLPDDPSSLLKYGKSGRAVYESALKGRKEKLESDDRRNVMLGGLAGPVLENPTPTTFNFALDRAVNYGLMTPAQKQEVMAQYGSSPESIKGYASQIFKGSINAQAQQADATSRANNAATVAASYYGHNVSAANSIRTDTREREKLTPLAGEETLPDGTKVPAYMGYSPYSNTLDKVSMPTVTVGRPTTLPTNVNGLTMPPAGAPTSPVARPITAAMPSAAAPSAAMPSAAAPTSIVPGGANAPAPVRFGPKSTAENLTEAQGKATGFALRAKEASDILDIVGKDGKVQPGMLKRVGEAVPLVGEGLGTMLNVTQTPQQQQVEQAQRSFVNAILRQESGAAINESEFNNAKKQYFPQPGDSKEVIDQKRLNRETAVRALEIAGGPGMKQTAPTTGIKAGTVEDGYRFKGGDPANKNNWEKQ